MARWLVLGLAGLALLASGCTDLLVGLADLTPASPYATVLYADATRAGALDAVDARDPTATEDPWVREVHRFQVPRAATNLSVHVGVQLVLPPDGARGEAQNVTARLDGPAGEEGWARFVASGEDRWRFPTPTTGTWTVTIEASGSGEVQVTALARGGAALVADR